MGLIVVDEKHVDVSTCGIKPPSVEKVFQVFDHQYGDWEDVDEDTYNKHVTVIETEWPQRRIIYIEEE